MVYVMVFDATPVSPSLLYYVIKEMLSFQVEEHAKSEEAKCELQAAKADECGDIEKAKHMQVL